MSVFAFVAKHEF